MAPKIKSSEITPESVFRERRTILKAAGVSVLGRPGSMGAASALGLIGGVPTASAAPIELGEIAKWPESATDNLSTFDQVSSYNNFYELGTDKGDPSKNAKALKTDPWTVEVGGECENGGKFSLEDILKPHALEERIYRLRCVEAWSMVVPWVGFPLGDLLKRFEPNSKAKYVEFQTLFDPGSLPGQKFTVLDWPYQEGLRIDEAMHPLTLMAVGLYGRVLPNQNGAPLRLVVPWKYGFKSIKSIVSINFVEKEPATSWNKSAPHEYGFYSNVNPNVSHPRWSQAKERRLDGESNGLGSLFASKIATEKFNGYEAEVASLYSNMDLKKNF